MGVHYIKIEVVITLPTKKKKKTPSFVCFEFLKVRMGTDHEAVNFRKEVREKIFPHFAKDKADDAIPYKIVEDIVEEMKLVEGSYLFDNLGIGEVYKR